MIAAGIFGLNPERRPRNLMIEDDGNSAKARGDKV